MTDNLPSGWEAKWSAPHGRYYYVNHNNGTTHWEKPVVASNTPKNNGAALPAGWEAKWSAPHSRYYYVNHATQTTQWNKPTEAGGTFSSQTTTQSSQRYGAYGQTTTANNQPAESSESESSESNKVAEQISKFRQIFLSFDDNSDFSNYLKNEKRIYSHKEAIQKASHEAYYTLFQANCHLDHYDLEKATKDLKTYLRDCKKAFEDENKAKKEQEAEKARQRCTKGSSKCAKE